MESILKKSDNKCRAVIWNHLLSISALVDPAGKAKEILQKAKASGGAEANLLTDIINKVEDTVSPNTNPMEAISSIMQSGVFTDLLSGMNEGFQDGSLDLSKLMGSVQTMVSSMTEQSGGNPEIDQTMGMLQNMMGSMTNMAEGAEGGMPDIAGMMSGMMGTMAGGEAQLSIEDQIDAQVEEAKKTGKLG